MLLFSLPMEQERVRTRNVKQVDEGLIAKIAAGDKQALAELYSQTKTAVYGFALSILRNRHDAEDAVQDTYVKIYSAASQYLPQGKPMAWILTITRNLALMKLRADKRTDQNLDQQEDPPDPREPVETTLDRLVLHSALTILTDEECQIVMLHAVAGQKHREIASMLAIPLSTTLSKYHRALSKLKKHLKEDA